MPVEEVYVNSFDATENQWSKVGVSPYLHNTLTDYIFSYINGQYMSRFGFPASAGSGTINSVKIRVEVMNTYVETGSMVTVYVWDGSSWVTLGTVYSPDVYTWKEFDVTNILNTWDKINGAKLRFCSVVYDGEIYVRRATRVVDYTPPVAVTETITAMCFPMLYLAKPKTAEELISSVEGATLVDVAKDFPKYLIKKDKANELKSKWT